MKKCFFWLKNFVSPKGTIGRIGFLGVFLCALLGIYVSYIIVAHFGYINHLQGFNFNTNLTFCGIMGFVCLIGGFLPLGAFLLVGCTYASAHYISELGREFLVLSIILDILFVFYCFQCIKRCRDMGRSGWYSLIPFYNPFVLLFKKGQEREK